MKKNNNELKNLSAQELAARADLLRRELFSVRLQKTTKPLKDTAFVKKMKKEIARTLTWLAKKQAEL